MFLTVTKQLAYVTGVGIIEFSGILINIHPWLCKKRNSDATAAETCVKMVPSGVKKRDKKREISIYIFVFIIKRFVCIALAPPLVGNQVRIDGGGWIEYNLVLKTRLSVGMI